MLNNFLMNHRRTVGSTTHDVRRHGSVLRSEEHASAARGRHTSRVGRWLAGCLRHRVDASIESPEATRQRIRRERALMAHGRPPFSLLVFDVGDPERNPRPAETLIRVLRRRLRIADAVGWLHRGRVAVILPATDRKGALRVAADVDRLLGPVRATIPCTLDAGRPVPRPVQHGQSLVLAAT